MSKSPLRFTIASFLICFIAAQLTACGKDNKSKEVKKLEADTAKTKKATQKRDKKTSEVKKLEKKIKRLQNKIERQDTRIARQQEENLRLRNDKTPQTVITKLSQSDKDEMSAGNKKAIETVEEFARALESFKKTQNDQGVRITNNEKAIASFKKFVEVSKRKLSQLRGDVDKAMSVEEVKGLLSDAESELAQPLRTVIDEAVKKENGAILDDLEKVQGLLDSFKNVPADIKKLQDAKTDAVARITAVEAKLDGGRSTSEAQVAAGEARKTQEGAQTSLTNEVEGIRAKPVEGRIVGEGPLFLISVTGEMKISDLADILDSLGEKSLSAIDALVDIYKASSDGKKVANVQFAVEASKADVSGVIKQIEASGSTTARAETAGIQRIEYIDWNQFSKENTTSRILLAEVENTDPAINLCKVVDSKCIEGLLEKNILVKEKTKFLRKAMCTSAVKMAELESISDSEVTGLEQLVSDLNIVTRTYAVVKKSDNNFEQKNLSKGSDEEKRKAVLGLTLEDTHIISNGHQLVLIDDIFSEGSDIKEDKIVETAKDKVAADLILGLFADHLKTEKLSETIKTLGGCATTEAVEPNASNGTSNGTSQGNDGKQLPQKKDEKKKKPASAASVPGSSLERSGEVGGQETGGEGEQQQNSENTESTGTSSEQPNFNGRDGPR